MFHSFSTAICALELTTCRDLPPAVSARIRFKRNRRRTQVEPLMTQPLIFPLLFEVSETTQRRRSYCKQHAY